MTDAEAYILENKYPGIIIVDSKAKGVKYLFDNQKNRFAIAGKKGKILLTIEQARIIKNELPEIIQIRNHISERDKS